jgi:hypothetical protein
MDFCYKLDRDGQKCREVQIPKLFTILALTTTKHLNRGTCSSCGYNNRVGTTSINKPPLGNINVTIFQR